MKPVRFIEEEIIINRKAIRKVVSVLIRVIALISFYAVLYKINFDIYNNAAQDTAFRQIAAPVCILAIIFLLYELIRLLPWISRINLTAAFSTVSFIVNLVVCLFRRHTVMVSFDTDLSWLLSSLFFGAMRGVVLFVLSICLFLLYSKIKMKRDAQDPNINNLLA